MRGYRANVFYDIPNGVYYGGRFNLAITGFYGGQDPEQSEFWTCDRIAPKGPNGSRFCDARYDRLFLEQSRLTDKMARRSVFDEMQRALAKAAVFVPLIYDGGYSAVNRAVRGWARNMLFEFSNAEDWDVVL